jgi:hypothetical protein
MRRHARPDRQLAGGDLLPEVCSDLLVERNAGGGVDAQDELAVVVDRSAAFVPGSTERLRLRY